MGREIKFRVWDSKAGHFWKDGNSGEDGYDWNEDWLCITLDGKIAIFDTEPYGGESEEQDRFIIQQYTGLKDMNGKEIYEGDILQGIESEWWDREHDKTVVVVDDIACLPTQWGDWSIEIEDYTIIGNIYENPDLLSKFKED